MNFISRDTGSAWAVEKTIAAYEGLKFIHIAIDPGRFLGADGGIGGEPGGAIAPVERLELPGGDPVVISRSGGQFRQAQLVLGDGGQVGQLAGGGAGGV